jgi:hypothetical protein
MAGLQFTKYNVVEKHFWTFTKQGQFSSQTKIPPATIAQERSLCAKNEAIWKEENKRSFRSDFAASKEDLLLLLEELYM